MHLDQEALERALHGELVSGTESVTREHLAQCETCQRSLAQKRADEAEIFSLFERLDGPRREPDIAVIRRASAGGPTVAGSQMRIAAGILVLIGVSGVAVYAIPSSLLRRWLDRSPRGPVPAVAPPVLRTQTAPPTLSGVSIVPGAATSIVFTSRQDVGELIISISDDAHITVNAPTGTVRYAVSGSRIAISNAGSVSSYQIVIPRSAARVDVIVAGERVWTTTGSNPAAPRSSASRSVVHVPLR